MAHGGPHEEAEHAAHLAHDPFDRRVAMSMVVIAAILATVKVIGHRAHNETLAYQIKSGVAQSQSGAYHTQASDQWNFFQAKKMREVLARQEAKILLQLATPAKDGPAGKSAQLPRRAKRIADLTGELKEVVGDDAGKQAERIVTAGEQRFQALLTQGYAAQQAERVVDGEMTANRYNAESKVIQKKAVEQEKKAKGYTDDSAGYVEKSDHKHHQADFFDLGELGVELALVLSSVAILTKRPGYWYGGLVLGLIGVIVTVVGFLAH